MIFKDKKIIFLLPPKTGTSSLLKLINDKEYNFEGTPPNRHIYLSNIVDHHNVRGNINEYKVYQLCRHPLDKLVSSFYFSQALPHIREGYPGYIKLSFEEVVHLLLDNKSYRILNTRKDFGGGRLFLPQTEWCDIECNITYIKLEDLKENTNILSEIFQDKFEDFPYINATHMRRKKHYLEMFNKDTLKIAQELYKTDFETLQYEYESII